jgi:hypothetical protein
MMSGTLGEVQTTRLSRSSTSAALPTTATLLGTEPAAGKLATVVVLRVAVTEAEAPQTAKEVAAAAETVVLPVVAEVVSEELVEAVVEGGLSEVVQVRVLLQHQREASHKPMAASLPLTSSDTPCSFFGLTNDSSEICLAGSSMTSCL